MEGMPYSDIVSHEIRIQVSSLSGQLDAVYV